MCLRPVQMTLQIHKWVNGYFIHRTSWNIHLKWIFFLHKFNIYYVDLRFSMRPANGYISLELKIHFHSWHEKDTMAIVKYQKKNYQRMKLRENLIHTQREFSLLFFSYLHRSVIKKLICLHPFLAEDLHFFRIHITWIVGKWATHSKRIHTLKKFVGLESRPKIVFVRTWFFLSSFAYLIRRRQL